VTEAVAFLVGSSLGFLACVLMSRNAIGGLLRRFDDLQHENEGLHLENSRLRARLNARTVIR